jgi:hypothetical protein
LASELAYPHLWNMIQADDMQDVDRLTEFLAGDHAKLQSYLGAAAFNMVGRRFASKYPSGLPNLRWFSRHLAKFLSETHPYSKDPELAEFASLEIALSAAFEAPVAPILSIQELDSYQLKDLQQCRIVMHPSVQRLRFTTNATSLWAALRCEERPPHPERLVEPSELLVWRQGAAARFRILGREEAKVVDALADGFTMAELKDRELGLPESEASIENVLGYVRGLTEAEVVSEVRCMKDLAEK